MSFYVLWQKAYVFTFLLSARLFIPPPELLARVCELCIKQQQLDQSPLDMVSTAPHINTYSRVWKAFRRTYLLHVSILITAVFPSTLCGCFCFYDVIKPVVNLSHVVNNRQKYASLAPRSCSCWQNGQRHSRPISGMKRWSDTSKTSSTG